MDMISLISLEISRCGHGELATQGRRFVLVGVSVIDPRYRLKKPSTARLS